MTMSARRELPAGVSAVMITGTTMGQLRTLRADLKCIRCWLDGFQAANSNGQYDQKIIGQDALRQLMMLIDGAVELDAKQRKALRA